MVRKRQDIEDSAQRESRKEILRRRRLAQQTRQLRLAIGGVAGLLGLVFLVAIVNEFFVAPNRAVAVVGGTEISLRDWQDRVRYERAQRIILLENQLQAVDGDVGIIQQFAGQMILDLQDAEALAQGVLDQMVSEAAIRQMAEARGITVTGEDIDDTIGETFNYFGGESPTPFPSPTNTVIPTPSLTPVPTSIITDVLPTVTPFPTATIGPTSTPRPTATPVSEQVFQEQFGELISRFGELGVDEETYREVVRQQLYRERLLDVVAEENELSTTGEQVSLYTLSFDAQPAAEQASELIERGDFLAVWNTIRTAPGELEVAGTASELLWRTREDLAQSLGEDVAEVAFSLPIGEPSEVIERQLDEETSNYLILQVSGREVREFSASRLQQDKLELLTSLVDEQLTGSLESTEFWRNRIPTQPVLDPKFLAAPTATPPLALPESLPTPDDGS